MLPLALLPLLMAPALALPPQLQLQLQTQPDTLGGYEPPSSDRVNVSLYVMSRCPDARLCENVFQQVFQKQGILDKINLDVGYIGWLNSSDPLGVSCKHGPLECLGNAHQLCLYEHLPVSQYSAVVECQNYPSSFPGDIGTLASVKRCANTVGVDWEGGVGRCIEGKHPKDGEGELGKEAKRLLKANIEETVERGVTTSCTIDIASTIVRERKRRCVVDDGTWRGCDDGHTAQDFIRVIEDEYKRLQE